jgi:ABC-2 type transport system permease protein
VIFASAETRRMAAALWYLQANSLVGAIRLRVKRLKQPKYLLGSLAFVAYLLLMFGPQAMRAQRMPIHRFDALAFDVVTTVMAILGLVWTLAAWAVPSGRAVLRFSEAEIAFLFPAPLSRVGLVNFSLLRAQLGIFVSAFLLSLVFARGRGLPGNSLQHATGIWLGVATLRLHTLAASFTLDRFAQGANWPWLRRLLAPTLIVLAGLALVVWLATQAPPPPLSGTGEEGFRKMLGWLLALLHTPPLSWLLAPFRWLAAPLVTGGHGWWLSMLPPAALLLLHYLWVVRANVAFEEAAIAAASKRAQRVEAARAGKWSWRSRKRKPNNQPFPLAERGPPAMAFLWSGLIGAGGGFWRARNLGLVALATTLLVFGLAASPWRPVLKIVGAAAAMSCLMSVLFGAMMMQTRLRDLLDLLDVYKASPLPGRQVALGQLLTPAALVALAQWYLLFVAILCVLAGGDASLGKLSFTWAGAFAVAIIGPLLCTLLMCIPFAWILWFPAWAASLGSRGGGFEAAGQRMIFTFAYFIASGVALLPALALGALVGWICSLLGAPAGLWLVVASVVAAIVLVVELAAIVNLLGARIDRFDVSTELH